MYRGLYSHSYQLRRELYKKIFRILLGIFISILTINLVQLFLFFPVMQKSNSMAPDIPAKSIVMTTPLSKTPKRGELFLVSPLLKEKLSPKDVIIDFVQRFFTAQQFSSIKSKTGTVPYIRRVIGLPGDTVYINNYVVYIKNKENPQYLTEFELSTLSYNLEIPAVTEGINIKMGAAGNCDPVTLGDNEYFLLSDNRLESFDSRIWGAVKKDSLMGKAFLIYFPLNKFRFLPFHSK